MCAYLTFFFRREGGSNRKGTLRSYYGFYGYKFPKETSNNRTKPTFPISSHLSREGYSPRFQLLLEIQKKKKKLVKSRYGWGKLFGEGLNRLHSDKIDKEFDTVHAEQLLDIVIGQNENNIFTRFCGASS